MCRKRLQASSKYCRHWLDPGQSFAGCDLTLGYPFSSPWPAVSFLCSIARLAEPPCSLVLPKQLPRRAIMLQARGGSCSQGNGAEMQNDVTCEINSAGQPAECRRDFFVGRFFFLLWSKVRLGKAKGESNNEKKKKQSR